MSTDLIPPKATPDEVNTAMQKWQLRFAFASAIAAWLGIGLLTYAHFIRKQRR